MTSPRGRLDATGYESTRKPAAWRRAIAWAWPMPTTFGTLLPDGFGGVVVVVVVVVVLVVVVVFVVVGGPSETLSPTTEPLFAFVPCAGTWEITSPAVLVDGMRVTRVPKPSGSSFAVA